MRVSYSSAFPLSPAALIMLAHIFELECKFYQAIQFQPAPLSFSLHRKHHFVQMSVMSQGWSGVRFRPQQVQDDVDCLGKAGGFGEKCSVAPCHPGPPLPRNAHQLAQPLRAWGSTQPAGASRIGTKANQSAPSKTLL